MDIGKIPGERLKKLVLNKTGKRRQDVLVHAGLGEDCAVVDLDGQMLVVSSDPITGASCGSGLLAVNVACNDLAAMGAKPVGIQVVLLLSPDTGDRELGSLMEELDQAARLLDIEILGGHTEVVSTVSKPVIVITAIGKAARSKYLTSAGAAPGDELVLTKGLGIEGTYILAADYEKLLIKKGVSSETITSAKRYADWLSVIKEGQIAVELGANAMHDVTEGGLFGAIDEMASAAGCGFELYQDKFPVNEETEEICSKLEIEPAGLISSGSLLIAIPEGRELVTQLAEAGIRAACIGQIINKGKYIIKDGREEIFSWAGRDELWRLMQKYPKYS